MALVIGASAEELAHVKECLADWECVNVPLEDGGTGVSPIPATAKLLIVYARKEEKRTFAVCEQLRGTAESKATPILLVIGRYEITQGTAVSRMGSAGFIITPAEEKELREKIADLLENS